MTYIIVGVISAAGGALLYYLFGKYVLKLVSASKAGEAAFKKEI